MLGGHPEMRNPRYSEKASISAITFVVIAFACVDHLNHGS